MSAYVITDIEVTDTEGYEEYKRAAAPTVAQYGGRYFVRGGRHETLEGDWRPNRVVMLEFPDVESAKRWWDSPEYARAREMRHRATGANNFILVEGM